MIYTTINFFLALIIDGSYWNARGPMMHTTFTFKFMRRLRELIELYKSIEWGLILLDAIAFGVEDK
jgi:hypothetical protein